MGWTTGVRIPPGARFFSPQHQDRLSAPYSFLSNGYLRGGWIFEGVKWPDLEADHSPPSNTEIKNGVPRYHGMVLPQGAAIEVVLRI
jgi:hypothetical protein